MGTSLNGFDPVQYPKPPPDVKPDDNLKMKREAKDQEDTAASHHEKMRTLDALDLYKMPNGEYTKRASRLDWLDLAPRKSGKPPISHVAKTIAKFEKKIKEALAPFFLPPTAYNRHKIITSNANAETCEDVKAKINDDIKAYLNTVDYNGLHFLSSFIKFWDETHAKFPNLTEKEVFRMFRPHSEEEVVTTQGSTCVGKAKDVVKKLHDMHPPIEAYIISESGMPDEPSMHVAVAVPCKNGVLLIEVESSDDSIIILKPNKSEVRIYKGDGTPEKPDMRVAFEIVGIDGNYKNMIPFIKKTTTFFERVVKGLLPKRSKTSSSQYLLVPLINSELSVMKRWFLTKVQYPVSSGPRKGQEIYSLKVNCIRSTFTMEIGQGANMKKARIPFAAFKDGKIDMGMLTDEKGGKIADPKEQDFFIGDSYFKGFKTDKSSLLKTMFDIVEHEKLFKKLLNVK